ncbi:MAG TPA: twin-arginine translocation signal domain-containing protein [Thermoanaerobaculia bacterium]|nr:twin-arginine translocation signal domain-containing protein [Thermoanaerobaculia bacterium]
MAKKKSAEQQDEGLDRRSFLKISSAAAAAVAVAAPTVAAAGAKEETKKKQAASPESPSEKPNLKGGWFSI